jgi:1-acyl-sn-glycerol-3-phosphate acyltransferase
VSAKPILALRSFLFNLFFFGWTAIYCLIVLPGYPFYSPRRMRQVARAWQRGLLTGLRVIVGLAHEVRGREHIPPGPVIFACKHQSAWETVACHALLYDVAVALKEELTRIPVFGWYLLRAGSIRIDRGAGSAAIRSLVAGARREVALGLSVLIFPEGTRRDPGDPADYKPGVAAVYNAVGLPVVPVALNSGLFWRRRGFMKYPGRIIIEFLPPIPPGLARPAFMRELERSIETATTRLLAEERPPGGGLDSQS